MNVYVLIQMLQLLSAVWIYPNLIFIQNFDKCGSPFGILPQQIESILRTGSSVQKTGALCIWCGWRARAGRAAADGVSATIDINTDYII